MRFEASSHFHDEMGASTAYILHEIAVINMICSWCVKGFRVSILSNPPIPFVRRQARAVITHACSHSHQGVAVNLSRSLLVQRGGDTHELASVAGNQSERGRRRSWRGASYVEDMTLR